MSIAGISLVLVLASITPTAGDSMIAVQAFDRTRDSTYLLASNDDVARFDRLWSQRSSIDRSDSAITAWNASFRIDFASSNQIWLYDARAGIAARLNKQLMPQVRIGDIPAFNELLHLAPETLSSLPVALDQRSE